jgi:Fe-S oxidoreductase
MQLTAIVVSLVVSVVAVALVVQAAAKIVRIVRLGQPAPTRRGRVGARIRSMLAETLGHSRLGKWRLIGLAHWFVFVGFGALLLTLITAYGELFSASWTIPWLGTWAVYETAIEVIAVLTGLGIIALILVRQVRHPRRLGRASRFNGSTFWQAYYVEATVVGIVLCVLALRGLDGALAREQTWSWHYPITFPLVAEFRSASTQSLSDAIFAVAMVKIVISMAWFIVIARNLSMGVAWHRFLAFFNIYFKRYPGVPTRTYRAGAGASSAALGPLQPIRSRGELVDFDDLHDDDVIGVGAVEDFTWKDLLDVSTCTECGRCQSQCPAWNTGKPLSPKLLVMDIRSHAYGKAPYLLAGGESADPDDLERLPERARAEASRPLVGGTEFDPAGHSLLAGGVIDPDVLWSCTTCGACVEECPVDIEHVDHIVDMRRHQVMIETAFPAELNGLFRNLEGVGNPWGLSSSTRLEWAKDLDFEVPVLGESAQDLSRFEYLFWVGCAGASDDRAKRTTQAVARLLHMAEVPFAVLGPRETCTGDSARRSGNEFVFQMLAQQNIETLNEVGAKKIVVTCPHCFNTIAREYPQVGGHYEVVHHTQLLNRLVREKRLVPVTPIEERVTYHDPCYLGRHNQVYEPPREILGSLPGIDLVEPDRTKSRSFCCGAGGARMWMSEDLGTRINSNRSRELVETEAETVAVGCPFCRTMIGDGVTAINGEIGGSTEVQDVAQLLLRAVTRAEGSPRKPLTTNTDNASAKTEVPPGQGA